MPNYDHCVRLAQEAAGVSETDAREIVDMQVREKERLAAAGTLDGMERHLAKYAMDQAAQAKMAANMARKHAALNILKRQELDGFLNAWSVETGGKSDVEGFMALLVGSHKRVTGARDSVWRRRAAVSRLWLGGLVKDLSRNPEVFDLIRHDKQFSDDVVREMVELREGGSPGVTGSRLAKETAETLATYAEMARLRLNDAGAFIRKLGGWVPQNHDAAKMLSAGRERWKEAIRPLLDMERTFGDRSGQAVDEALDEIFQNIVTGRGLAVTPAERGQYLGPRNLARSMGKTRFLHFRDAEAWLAYHEGFGRGNILVNIVHHLDQAARKVALMEGLGPNPEAMVAALVETRKSSIRASALPDDLKAKRIEILSRAFGPGRSGKIGRALSEAMGETLIPENITGAKISSTVRAVNSMAKLGGATLSALADLANFGINARFNGRNLFEAYLDAMGALFKGRGDAETRNVSYLLGTLYDGILGDISSRFNAQDSVPGYASHMMNVFFKASGLTAWTDRLKAGYVRMLSTHLAGQVGSDWNALDGAVRESLRYHGFGERQWEIMRHMTSVEADGRRYLLPEKARALPDAMVDQLIPERVTDIATRHGRDPEAMAQALDRARNVARQRLETDLMGFYADETMFAVLEPDDRTRMIMTMGTRPGTLLGEIVRFVTQFKSFPVAYVQRGLMGRRFQRPDRGLDLPGITQAVAGMLALGYGAMTAKDLSKGKLPRDPRKAETWFAALQQSGGAGIYGDFLFSKYNRFGGGFVDTLAGPTAGTAGHVVEMASNALRGKADAGEAMRLALDNTPFINLWYTRAALDYGILYHLQEMLSPGTLSRRERRMREEYGQQYLFPPSTIVKRGGGFK